MLVFLLLVALTICQTNGEGWNSTWTRYQKSKPHGMTVVSVNLHLQSISQIDSSEGLYQVRLTFRQEWKDHRLAHTAQRHYLPLYQSVDRSEIWTPDTFFSNEIDGYPHTMLQDNSMVRVSPSGSILLSRRITLTLRCPMNLSNFPFDVQICSMFITSFAHTRNLIDYQWNTSQPIQLDGELLISGFELRQYVTEQCHQRSTTGDYSCIQVDFILKRHWRHHLFQVMIPMSTLVVLAWLAFWIRETNVRMFVLMMCFSLALVATGVQNSFFPQTNYVKMIDIFTGVGIFFIFAAIVESVAVSRWSRDALDKGEPEHKIDLTARVVYPVCYAGFVAIFSLSALLR